MRLPALGDRLHGPMAVAATAALLMPSPAHALAMVYTAHLNGASEAPPNASSGTGTATVTIDDILHTMLVQVVFSNLTGTTTAAHIHAATAVPGTGTAGVATTTPTFTGFPLGVTSGSYAQTLDMTQASSYNASFITANGGSTSTAEAALFSAIADGKSYFNIHTNLLPGGEIRGFLAPSPTNVPGPVPLFGAAAAFGMSRRLRRRIQLGA